MQWRALVREVPLLLSMLWVCQGHRLRHWDYVWDPAAAGTICMGKVFSSKKTLHRSCRPEQQPCPKDTYTHMDRPPPE